MKLLTKINLFAYIIICLLCFELILQAASFIFLLKAKRQNLVEKDNFNIVCIGDSFTYGLGASSEKSYPKQLEQILNKTYPDRHIKVINLGVPGYNSSQSLRCLKENLDFYNPKIILTMTGMNNCWNFIDSSYFKIRQFRHSNLLDFRIKFFDAILCRSRSYKFIKIAFVNLIHRLKPNRLQYHQDYALPKRKFRMPPRSDKLKNLLKLGLRHYEEGRYDLSEMVCRKALELAPKDYEPHWFMGRFYNFKGQKEMARKELILSAQYAPDPYTIAYILADIQDRRQSRNSSEFKEFTSLVKKLRTYWVEKFGENYVQQFIDPITTYNETDLERVLFYDFTEMADYLKQRNVSMIVLTYPQPATKFRYPEDIYYRISNYLNLPLVDNNTVFNKFLEIYRYDELFSKDGHCQSQGYRLIAKNIFKALKKQNLVPL